MFMAIDALDFPELHDESIPHMAFLKNCTRLLAAAGVRDFNMQVLCSSCLLVVLASQCKVLTRPSTCRCSIPACLHDVLTSQCRLLECL